MKPPRAQSAPPHPGEIEKLVQIEKPIYGGAFLARVEGKAVFVPLTLPGERALVHITEDKHGYSTAEVDQIVTAAKNRTSGDTRPRLATNPRTMMATPVIKSRMPAGTR